MTQISKPDESFILKSLQDCLKTLSLKKLSHPLILPHGHLHSSRSLNPLEIKSIATQWSHQVRAWLALGDAPILDLNFHLELHGLSVFTLKLPSRISGISLLSNTYTPLILLNQHDDTPRRNFTLARELAMITLCAEWLPLVKQKSIVFPPENIPAYLDTLLNEAAAFLLIPEKILLKADACWHLKNIAFEQLIYLKCSFGVSAEAFLTHLFNLKIISKSHFQNLKHRIGQYYLKTEYAEPYSDQHVTIPSLSKNLNSLFQN